MKTRRKDLAAGRVGPKAVARSEKAVAWSDAVLVRAIMAEARARGVEVDFVGINSFGIELRVAGRTYNVEREPSGSGEFVILGRPLEEEEAKGKAKEVLEYILEPEKYHARLRASLDEMARRRLPAWPIRRRRRERPSSGPADTSQQARMRDDFNNRDLNALAANLGLTFEQAAAKLTAAAARSVSDDPLSRARRIVRSYDRNRAKNPDTPETPEVATARSFVNRTNYQNRKAKTAKP